MKQVVLKTIAMAFLATSIGSIPPANASESSFNFDPEAAKVFCAGAAVSAAAIYGFSWFFGKEKPAPTTASFTQSQLKQEILEALKPVNEELAALKLQITGLSQQEANILELLRAEDPAKSPLAKMLLHVFEEQKLNGRKIGLRDGKDDADAQTTPRKQVLGEKDTYVPSPIKKLTPKELTGPLSTHQTNLKHRGEKEQLLGPIWDILKDEDTNRARTLCKTIEEITDEGATFDLIPKTDSLDKLIVTINGERSIIILRYQA